MQAETRYKIKRFLASANHWIIIVNIIVFLLTDLLLSPSASSFVISKGSLGYRTFLAGEYYRIITCMFLHGGISHITGNVLMIFTIGDMLENRLGTVRYLILYFLTGVVAGITSMGYNMMMATNSSSIGASGAGFGLLGAFVAILLMDRGLARSLTLARIAMYIAFSVFVGITSATTDVAAHIGGLVAGLVICPILIITQNKNKRGIVR